MLVDDKFEIDHDNIIAMLKTVTNQPVKYVINTHYHGDHSGGNAKLQAIGTLAVASIAGARAHGRGESVGPARHHGRRARGDPHRRQDGRDLQVRPRAYRRRRRRAVPASTASLAAGDMFANGAGTSAQLVDYRGGGSAKECGRKPSRKRSSSTSTR